VGPIGAPGLISNRSVWKMFKMSPRTRNAHNFSKTKGPKWALVGPESHTTLFLCHTRSLFVRKDFCLEAPFSGYYRIIEQFNQIEPISAMAGSLIIRTMLLLRELDIFLSPCYEFSICAIHISCQVGSMCWGVKKWRLREENWNFTIFFHRPAKADSYLLRWRRIHTRISLN
jgi:hypothetical protein